MNNLNELQKIFDGTINISMEKIYIELTNRCNLSCIHCYNDSNHGHGMDLPFNTVNYILEFTKECGLSSVALSGGEALFHPDIDKILAKCKALELKVTLLTNGTYYENKEYEELLLRYIPELQVSLDGPDRESNDHIRGAGSFDKTIQFIQHLKEIQYANTISVNMVLTEATIHNYKNMVELSQQLKVERLTYSFITLEGRAKNADIGIADDTLRKIVHDINTNIKPYEENNCQGVGMNHICSLTNVTDNMIKLQPKITFRGDVFPCQMHSKSEYIIGNVINDTLVNVLNGITTKRFLSLMFLRRFYMEDCVSCTFSDICERGCMAKAVNDYHNPFATDGCCFFYKKQLLQMIKEGLNKE